MIEHVETETERIFFSSSKIDFLFLIEKHVEKVMNGLGFMQKIHELPKVIALKAWQHH